MVTICDNLTRQLNKDSPVLHSLDVIDVHTTLLNYNSLYYSGKLWAKGQQALNISQPLVDDCSHDLCFTRGKRQGQPIRRQMDETV